MGKHTPGRWEAYELPGRLKLAVRANAGGLIADIHQRSGPEITLANARLIAAAPELLEALKSFPGFTDDATIGDRWVEQMRSAISKAEEGSK